VAKFAMVPIGDLKHGSRPNSRPWSRSTGGSSAREAHIGAAWTVALEGAMTEGPAKDECVRLGQWTSGPRTDEQRLRQLAAELRVPLRVEGGWMLQSKPRGRTNEGRDRRAEGRGVSR
jgi:hypothetical protein